MVEMFFTEGVLAEDCMWGWSTLEVRFQIDNL